MESCSTATLIVAEETVEMQLLDKMWMNAVAEQVWLVTAREVSGQKNVQAGQMGLVDRRGPEPDMSPENYDWMKH